MNMNSKEHGCDIDGEMERELMEDYDYDAVLIDMERQWQAMEKERLDNTYLEMEGEIETESKNRYYRQLMEDYHTLRRLLLEVGGQSQAEERKNDMFCRCNVCIHFSELRLHNMDKNSKEYDCDIDGEMERELMEDYDYDAVLIDMERQWHAMEKERLDTTYLEMEEKIERESKKRKIEDRWRQLMEDYDTMKRLRLEVEGQSQAEEQKNGICVKVEISVKSGSNFTNTRSYNIGINSEEYDCDNDRETERQRQLKKDFLEDVLWQLRLLLERQLQAKEQNSMFCPPKKKFKAQSNTAASTSKGINTNVAAESGFSFTNKRLHNMDLNSQEYDCGFDGEMETQLMDDYEAALIEMDRQTQSERQERFEDTLGEKETQKVAEVQKNAMFCINTNVAAEPGFNFTNKRLHNMDLNQEYDCGFDGEMETQLMDDYEAALIEMDRQTQSERQERFEDTLGEKETQKMAEVQKNAMFFSGPPEKKSRTESRPAASTSKGININVATKSGFSFTNKRLNNMDMNSKEFDCDIDGEMERELMEDYDAALIEMDRETQCEEPERFEDTVGKMETQTLVEVQKNDVFCPPEEKSKAESETAVSTSKGKKTLQDYKDLYLNQVDCDVIIRVKGREFPAHRNILKARSPVFASTLRHDAKERDVCTVDVEDCDPASFSDFLCFLYCGSLENISMENVFSLFATADIYGVQDLRMECLEFMGNNLSSDNFCDIITVAFQHSEKDLIEIATGFFEKNLQKIIVTVKWQSLLIAFPMQCNELLINALVNKK